MSVDKYLDRVYRPGQYNCLHFTCEVWADLTGQDIRERLEGLLAGALRDRTLGKLHARAFRALPGPVDPCLVLFQGNGPTPHMGVWIRGKVLHIREREHVQHNSLFYASLPFTKTRFILPT